MFSIIIPSYNRSNLLKMCLESVLCQTYTDWEAIVVDNNSIESNREIVESYNDSRITFISNPNYGIIAVSRNIGLERAKGDWICFLDSDDIWMPNKLEQIFQYLDKYEFIFHDMKIYSITDNLLKITGSLSGRQLTSDPFEDMLLDGNPCINSSVVIKRNIIDKVGPISQDPNLVGVEDFDYWLRIVQQTKHIKYLNQDLGYYYVGPSSVSNTDRQVTRMNYLYEKHLHCFTDSVLKEEISRRLSYRQGRIYQQHNIRNMAIEKFRNSFLSYSIKYKILSLLRILTIKLYGKENC